MLIAIEVIACKDTILSFETLLSQTFLSWSLTAISSTSSFLLFVFPEAFLISLADKASGVAQVILANLKEKSGPF